MPPFKPPHPAVCRRRLPQVGRACLARASFIYLNRAQGRLVRGSRRPRSTLPLPRAAAAAGQAGFAAEWVSSWAAQGPPLLPRRRPHAPPFLPRPRPAASCQSSGGAEASGGGGRRDGQLRHSPAAAIRGKIGRPAPPSSGSDRPSPRRYPSTPPSVPPLLLQPRLSGR